MITCIFYFPLTRMQSTVRSTQYSTVLDCRVQSAEYSQSTCTNEIWPKGAGRMLILVDRNGRLICYLFVG